MSEEIKVIFLTFYNYQDKPFISCHFSRLH